MSLLSDLFISCAVGLYIVVSLGLLIYGLNSYVMLYLFMRKIGLVHRQRLAAEVAWQRRREDPNSLPLPKITTQLPLYNELNVAERALRAVASFDYPPHLHQIQVLDDSTDSTHDLIDATAAELRKGGLQIDIIRRKDRIGYKAGALAAAMPLASGELIAIFDADFVPPKDFLLKTLPHFETPHTALVQTRWEHLNRNKNFLTRAQSAGIDGHFAVEQNARCANGLFLNFNGTAGIWRKAAIIDAGGWTADTLTEDLDLSYRAQRGDGIFSSSRSSFLLQNFQRLIVHSKANNFAGQKVRFRRRRNSSRSS